MIARFRYRIPFARPLVTAAGTYTHREGLILRYGTAPPYRFAEAAPLPGFSTESLDQVLACPVHDVPPTLPSLRLAVDLLRWQLTPDPRPCEPVPVNALIGSMPVEAMVAAAASAVEAGYGTLKFKLGPDPDAELEALARVRRAFPDIHLRADANRAFTRAEATLLLDRLAPLRLAYLEEPVRTATELHDLAAGSPVPLAADEHVRTPEEADAWIRGGRIRHLVLKPACIGDMATLFGILQQANAAGVRCTITTLLESGVGRRLTARLVSRYVDLHWAHGLGTGTLFSDDLARHPDPIMNGHFHLADEVDGDLDLDRLEPL